MDKMKPKRCKALRMALNVTQEQLASDIFTRYTMQNPTWCVGNTICVYAEIGFICSVIDIFENATTPHEVYDAMTMIANAQYNVIDNIIPVLFDIRRKKVKEYGDWYKDLVIFSYKVNLVHLNEYDGEFQKKSYENLRSWLHYNSELTPYKRIIHSPLGDMNLYSGGDNSA